MFLAVRQGNGPVLLPAAYRSQYAKRGWTMKVAPEGFEPVTLPTPLAQGVRVAITKVEPSKAAEAEGGSPASSKPKRKGRPKKTSKPKSPPGPKRVSIAITPPQNDTPQMRNWMEETARSDGWSNLKWSMEQASTGEMAGRLTGIRSEA